jgi:hypothetical protein
MFRYKGFLEPVRTRAFGAKKGIVVKYRRDVLGGFVVNFTILKLCPARDVAINLY